MKSAFHFSTPYIAALILVSGCGGGGGNTENGSQVPVSTSPNAPANPVLPPAVVSPEPSQPTETPSDEATVPNAIVESVPPTNYNPLSENLIAFNLLNAERSNCGFGKLAQNSALDSAAQAHSIWALRYGFVGHGEDPALVSGFTGQQPFDRATSFGYPSESTIGEDQTSTAGISDISGRGAHSIRSLLSAPYHLQSLVAGFRDIGVSIVSSTEVSGKTNDFPRTFENFNLGFTERSGSQEPGPDVVLSYPCEGTTGAAYRVTTEAPNPVPGRDLGANPIGPGIVFTVKSGQVLELSSAVLVTANGNTSVPLRPTMTKSSDPNGLLGGHQAILIPDSALQRNTQYRVTVSGKNSGTSFYRSFVFTTGTVG